MDNDVTATLARFASRLTYEDIPERVRERTKDLLLDALACALAGYRGEDTPKVMRFAAALGQSQESGIVGGGSLSLTGATAFNGFLITAVSMCDVYRPTATHFQPVIVSPALAIAERDEASGRDLLVALVSGFETTARIAAGVDYAAFRKQEFVATRQFLTVADGGFYPTYCGGSAKDAATAALGEHWELEQIALRPTPTSAASQGIVTALFDLIRRHDLKAGRTKRLRLHVSPACYDAYRNRRNYSGKWEASASLHYTAAVVLHDRELWLDQFEPQRYDDPALKRFSKECVELFGDPTLTAEQAIVEAEMNDGTVLSAHCKASKGTPENPLTRAEIEDKFRKSAKDRLAHAAVERVLEAITHLEDLKSMRPLMDSLRKETD